MIVFLNGRLLPDKKAAISIYDHGFLYGDGVYETIRVYRGKPFLLREHLERLNNSLRGIQLDPPMSLIEIGEAVEKVVAANKHKEAVVRLTVTRGPGPYGFDPRPMKNPTIVITSIPFVPYPTSFHKKGISLAVVGVRRNNPLSIPPTVKSTSCLNSVLAKIEANDLKADEGVMLTHDNVVAEGTVSNVFIVADRVVMTPPLEGALLPGCTRGWVCGLARNAGFSLQEKNFSAADLAGADEAFLTNTTMEIMPVTEIVARVHPGHRRFRIGPKSRAVGPITRRLMSEFATAKRNWLSTKKC